MKKFGLVKGQKENYFIIALGLVLVVIVVTIGVIALSEKKQASQPTEVIVTPFPSLNPTPTTTITTTHPLVTYNREAQAILLDRKINRKPLSASDAQLKTELLALLPTGQIAGVIHETKNIRVEYIESLDLFKVEILTTNIAVAKDEANVWFRSQGMSQQGICDLPLGFYLNWEIANMMRNTDITFNPLPNGCQQ